MAAIAVTRLLFVYGENNSIVLTSAEDAGYVIAEAGASVIITLNDTKKSAVQAAIEAASGIGNVWVQIGEGMLLTEKQLPNEAHNTGIH